jgi:hypothetical protein
MKWFITSLVVLCGYSLVESQTIVNAYAKVTTVNAARTTLTVTNVNEANHTFSVGEQVIVMQMQDDCVGTNTTNVATFGNLGSIANAGVYEIRIIASRLPASGTPTAVTLSQALTNTFNTGANSSVQLITYRNLGANYTTTANITGLAWDGNVGGVIAIRVTNTLTLNHSITADGIGFRGGNMSNSFSGPICTAANSALYISNNANQGWKGEGIYESTNAGFNNSRGRILNGGGGGGDHNAGGGGGGNFSSGGQGGVGYNNCTANPAGGLGGLGLSTVISSSRMFMGGGGGGGQQNDGRGTNGGQGGGIILLKAQVLASNTVCSSAIRITANGMAAASNTGLGDDGVGGGGAAGSIICQVTSYSLSASCPLSISANGGNGGTSIFPSANGSVAGGGGGGQGVIVFSTATPTTNVASTTTNGLPGADNNVGYTTAGPGGGTNNTGIIPNSVTPLPVELLYFEALCTGEEAVELSWETAMEKNNDYFTVEKSDDAIHWTGLGTIDGAGASLVKHHYNLKDVAPAGITYYRLKQTDHNGKATYSRIVSVDCSPQLTTPAYIYPNPAGDELHVVGGNIEVVEIIDCLGQLVMALSPQQATAAQSLPISGVAPGVYTVRILQKNKKLCVLKFIKQ